MTTVRPRAAPAHCCGACAHFDNAPASLEAAFGGLSAMSSGYASVRAEDGLCARRGLYLSARESCAAFAPRRPAESPTERRPSALARAAATVSGLLTSRTR